MTPHRIGSIGNRIKNQSFNTTISGDFFYKFTPGVNGDYANPSTNFSIIFPNKSREIDSNKAFLT